MYVLEDTAESSHFDVTKLRESCKTLSFYATQTMLHLSVLEQVGPDIALTSTRTDEACIDFIRDFSMSINFSIRAQETVSAYKISGIFWKNISDSFCKGLYSGKRARPCTCAETPFRASSRYRTCAIFP